MQPRTGGTIEYMLLICVDSAIEPFKTDPTIEKWLDEVGRRRLDGSELRSRRDATTVRTRGDEVLLTDGPFAETREYVAGYDVVECSDLDEATLIRMTGDEPHAVESGCAGLRPDALKSRAAVTSIQTHEPRTATTEAVSAVW
jgi:hypothetical protein